MLKNKAISIIIVLAVIVIQLGILAPAATAQTDEVKTPFQQWITETIDEREVQGLPVPSSVSFEYSYETNNKINKVQEHGIMPGEQFTITAKTIIHFDNPEQAGLEKWSAFIVEENIPPDGEGFVLPGDYTQIIHDKLEQEIPGIWDRYDFGYEPRTLTIEEMKKITFSDKDIETINVLLSESTDIQEILMGFTFAPENPNDPEEPFINWTIGPFTWDILGVDIFEFEAGFRCDFGLGLRLPMEVNLTSPDSISEGSTYTPTSSVKGLDWSAEDFEQSGVGPARVPNYL